MESNNAMTSITSYSASLFVSYKAQITTHNSKMDNSGWPGKHVLLIDNIKHAECYWIAGGIVSKPIAADLMLVSNENKESYNSAKC